MIEKQLKIIEERRKFDMMSTGLYICTLSISAICSLIIIISSISAMCRAEKTVDYKHKDFSI